MMTLAFIIGAFVGGVLVGRARQHWRDEVIVGAALQGMLDVIDGDANITTAAHVRQELEDRVRIIEERHDVRLDEEVD